MAGCRGRRFLNGSAGDIRPTLKVERAVVTVAGERVVTTTISAAGNRTVYLPPHIVEDAQQQLDTYPRREADALAFPRPRRTPPHPP